MPRKAFAMAPQKNCRHTDDRHWRKRQPIPVARSGRKRGHTHST